MQCDFDTIGTTSNASDIETLLVIHDLFERLGFSKFTIRVNNRLVLNGLLQKLGLADKSAGVLRCIDKLPKAGREKVIAEMTERVGATAEQAADVIAFAELKGEPFAILTTLESQLAGNDAGLLGVARLRELFTTIGRVGVPVERVELDLAIARGLDYYTGTIYETFLGDLPGIGSVCSGGRYDNLAELFTTQKLPGVGREPRTRPVARRDGRAGNGRRRFDAGQSADRVLRRESSRRLSPPRSRTASRRTPRRGLPRSGLAG